MQALDRYLLLSSNNMNTNTCTMGCTTHTHTHTGREGVSVLLGAPSVLWEGNRQCAVRQNWELGDLSSNSDSAIGVM